jgi:dTDP-4-amino-4,6-dideoxygalactose transaminase
VFVTVTIRTVPLLDLQAQHKTIRNEVLEAVTRVIDSQRFILGDEVKALEEEVGRYCACEHAIGCASGSDALILALAALNIGPGDEVLTTPYSFFATAGAISHVGATPVFVDIDEQTFNIDAERAVDALRARPGIRAVIPVHLFGGCADLDPIIASAQERGVAVIEDAAQSIGSEYKGKRAGSLGQIGCFSFFPSKNLGAYGDGGLVTTRDAALAERLVAFRAHGSRTKYYHDWIGYNSRLDSIQAAVLRVKLRHLDDWSAARGRNADLYRNRLAELRVPVTPATPAAYQTRHIYNQFVIRAARRDDLRAHLAQNGIGAEVYYPLPLHLQRCYAFLGHKPGDFPVSERLAAESLALPVYPELTTEEIEYVCRTIQAFYA